MSCSFQLCIFKLLEFCWVEGLLSSSLLHIALEIVLYCYDFLNQTFQKKVVNGDIID